jgi:hypothetical protein
MIVPDWESSADQPIDLTSKDGCGRKAFLSFLPLTRNSYFLILSINNTGLHSKDNEAARRRLRRRIIDTLRKPTTMTTKLAEEGGLV